MSIGKRIETACTTMAAGDAESALIPACIAAAATAKKAYPSASDNVGFKTWLHDHLGLVTRIASGGFLIINCGFNVGIVHPDLRPDREGNVTFEQVFYHLIRCGLVHTAQLPSQLEFVRSDVIVRSEGGKLQLTERFVDGLIWASVVDPRNSNERVSANLTRPFYGQRLYVNAYWGQKAKLEQALEASRRSH